MRKSTIISSSKTKYKSIYLGIFIISMISLGFEVSLTRIFSVMIGNHYAYLVISIALLGYGASGTFLAINEGFLKKDAWIKISNLCILFSLSIILSYIAVNKICFDPAALSWDLLQIGRLFIDFFVLSVPFFFSGLIISSSIYLTSNLVDKIYFADMSGAAAGCFIPCLFFPLLSSAELVIITLSISALICSVIFYNYNMHYFLPVYAKDSNKHDVCRKKQYKISFLIKSGLFISFIGILVFVFPSVIKLQISPYRDIMQAQRYEDSRMIYTKWGSSSRIDVIESPAVRYAPGLSFKYLDPLPYQIGVTIDGGNLQAITFPEDEKIDFIDYLPSSLPFRLKKMTNDDFSVFVVSPGGGLDLLSAVYYGAKKVVGVESNPEMAAYLKEVFSKNIHFTEDEDVQVYGDVERCYLKRTGLKYDVIQLPLTNVFGASSGIFSTGIDYNLTVEAFREYYSFLEKEGYLSVTSYLRPVPAEEARILSIILESLKDADDPMGSIAIIRSFGTITFIVKKGEFQDIEIEEIREFCKNRNFDPVYFQGIEPSETNVYNKFKEPVYYNLVLNMLDSETRMEFIENYIFNIKPVTDDAPFFHNFIRLDDLKEIYASTGGKWIMILEGGFIPPLVTILALILSFLLIIMPHLFKKKDGKDQYRSEHAKPICRFLSVYFLGYFILIGMAYMFVEVAFLNRLQILFGSMSFSISLVLSALLISSGLGSYIISKKTSKNKNLVFILSMFLVGLISFYSIFFDDLINVFLIGLPLTLRIVLSVILIFPVGFLMGMFFPTGICLAEKTNKKLIPWLWCANGSASVIASPLSLSAAVYFGFSAILAAASVFYLLAYLLIHLLLRTIHIQ